ncbi:MAG: hypothetical protein OEY44_04415 [Candidatus Peregrinibacteria bacterium]|nr:hypothetical protein [Candidatus Peregrinibacteria bacterium]
MRLSSKQMITVIVAFLLGILAFTWWTSNPTPSSDTSEVTEEIEEENKDAEEEGEEKNEETEGEVAPAAKVPKPVASVTSSAPSGGLCYPSISGRKDERHNAILINWTACNSSAFQYYKIVKSTKNPNPSYPSDPVALSSSNKQLTNFVDKTVSRASTYYYRACAVQGLEKVGCGNVISVTY